MAEGMFGFGGFPNFDTSQKAGLGQFASGIAGLFGNKNPADTANNIIGTIPGETNPYYEPFFNAGKGQLPGLEDQYNQLLGNPGKKLNDIGQNFQNSPGFQFALQQALQGAGHAAAAGGMAGSPQHEMQNMGIATQLENQDYNNWLQQATGLYTQGLQGSQGLVGIGANAGNNQANMVAQAKAQQAANAYNGQAGKNKSFSDSIGNIVGGAFSII